MWTPRSPSPAPFRAKLGLPAGSPFRLQAGEPTLPGSRSLLTRTNTTIAFCSPYRALKGMLLPSASTTRHRAASRSSPGSGGCPQPRALPTCCVTGCAGGPAMARPGSAASARPARRGKGEEEKGGAGAEGSGAAWLWGSAGAGWEGIGSFPFLEETRGWRRRAPRLSLKEEVASLGPLDKKRGKSAAKIAARRWRPGCSLCLENITKSNGAPPEIVCEQKQWNYYAVSRSGFALRDATAFQSTVSKLENSVFEELSSCCIRKDRPSFLTEVKAELHGTLSGE